MPPVVLKSALIGLLLTGVTLGACDAQTTGAAERSATPGLSAAEKGEVPHSDLPPPSREVFTNEACDYEEWIGRPLDEAAVKSTGRTYRILTPDSMMTMDFNAERLNVVHDGKNVTRVWCG